MSLPIPRGFRLAGVHCGVKRNPENEDLTLAVSDAPAVAAGVYTQNLVCAAPVVLCRERTPSDNIRTVVINSGNANACTGEKGLEDAREMARLAAAACGAEPEQALVMSTGIIGEPLPMDKIAAGIAAAATRLGTDESALHAAARGIMTTDKFEKLAAKTLTLAQREIRIVGIAKGAGMIGPNMATMLGLILTDAPLAKSDAQAALSAAANETFNCISVEGHTSTNDTVLLLASGAAGGDPLAGDDFAAFGRALLAVCTDLAKAIPDDGEGATHLITIDVAGCATRADAHQIAKTIAASPLVKTAVTGADPNWGRIVSAAGYAGVKFDPGRVDLYLNDVLLYKQGAPADFDAPAVSQSMRDSRQVHILLQLGQGDAGIRFWTSDLTAEYIHINADYHT